MADRVRFLGTLDKALLAEVFRAADVFAIASTSESQSMTLLQTMSSGLPSVGARWRALPEYIASDSGFLAMPGEPADFANQIERILSQPRLREEMRLNAYRTAQKFSIANVVDAWESIYTGTLKRHRHEFS
jgi:glycosyltransferase involved in cell wall biosynthesis